MMKRSTAFLGLLCMMAALVLLTPACKKKDADKGGDVPPDPPPVDDSVYFRGMDLSFQPEIRQWQTDYYDLDGQQVDLLPFLVAKGVNLVRLRLWHSPDTTFNGLESVLSYAKELKANGMELLLDLHYSDKWADPGHQVIPKAWENLTIDLLKDSVYAYTFRVVNRFKEEGVLPVIIQVGNETNAGFLWDMGRVGGAYNSNWGSYTMLLKSAVKAIRDAEEEKEIRVMLHIAGINSATWFFDNITQYLVDYDVIGLSFYSIWHGTNYTAWEDKFLEVANRYSKEIMVVETGYPWTLGWNDWTNNIYGLEEQLFPDLPATPEGQKQFLQRLDSTISSLGKKGIGFCYWAPDLVAFKGPQAQDGSVWENVAVFDFDNQALPVIEVFSGKAQ